MREKILSHSEIEKLNTTVKCEALAGSTIFISMAYILSVNPAVLGTSGMDEGAVFTATALANAIGCILMEVLAHYPTRMASALGINTFFAYSVCLGMGIPWETALSGVFIASLIFILITIFKPWEMITDAIPADLKYAISGGIGLFIAFLGLSEGGIIVSNESTLVGLGPLGVGSTWLAILGLVVTAILLIRRVPSGIFIGMTATTILGLITGLIPVSSETVAAAPSLKSTFLVTLKHVGDIDSLQMWVVALTFLFVTFFDITGTLVGLTNQTGFVKNNKVPRVGEALASDSTTMLAGSLLDTSPVGTSVESSAGIAVGGRSGTTAITTGVFFLLDSFFSPLPSAAISQVTAPALIMVGVLMTRSLRQIEWGKLEIVISSFLISTGMPLTCSISDGVALGSTFCSVTVLATKEGKEVSPIMYGLFSVFVGSMQILNVKQRGCRISVLPYVN